VSQLFGEVLPLAVGATISPTLLATQVLILSMKDRPRAKAWAFTAGAAAALAVFAVVVAALLARAPAAMPEASESKHGVLYVALHLVCGLLLLALGARSLRPRPTPGERHASRISTMLTTAPPRAYLAVGVVGLLVDVSSLVLFVPAMHDILRSTESDAAKWAAFVFLFLMVLMPLIVPLLLVTALGAKADGVLASINGFVPRHSHTINAAVCFLLAAYLLWLGAAALVRT